MSKKNNTDIVPNDFALTDDVLEEMFLEAFEPQPEPEKQKKAEIDLPKPPKDETIFERLYIDNNLKYAVTAGRLRDMYYLCEVKNGKCVKTGKKSPDPRELDAMVFGENM